MSTKTKDPSDLELMLYADGELEGDRIAAVEAYLARNVAAQKKLRALDIASNVIREHAVETASPADGIADLVMASIAAESKGGASDEKPQPVPRRKAANDNARGIWAVAAIAVAAAASLLLWGRGPTESGVAIEPSAGVIAPKPHVDTTSNKPDAPKADESGHGVEVAAVDFGALTGALFYVPTGAAASETTTVVWLSDDSGGGDE